MNIKPFDESVPRKIIYSCYLEGRNVAAVRGILKKFKDKSAEVYKPLSEKLSFGGGR
jgi:hypothetical protein